MSAPVGELAPRAPRPRPRTGRPPRLGRRACSRARRPRRDGRECSSPPQHEPGAEAGADREEDEVVDAARDAPPLLAEGGEVDVVLDRQRQREPRSQIGAEVAVLEARARSSPGARARRSPTTTPGTPTTTPSMSSGDRSADCDQRAAQARRSRRSRCRRRRPRSRRPGARGSRRTGRRSRRAGTARRGRGRARAPRPGSARRTPRRSSGGPGSPSVSRTRPASSSDCSASETVGFEMPTRREISAREIGAEARIASSTVRSLRSLSRGRRCPRRSTSRKAA